MILLLHLTSYIFSPPTSLHPKLLPRPSLLSLVTTSTQSFVLATPRYGLITASSALSTRQSSNSPVTCISQSGTTLRLHVDSSSPRCFLALHLNRKLPAHCLRDIRTAVSLLQDDYLFDKLDYLIIPIPLYHTSEHNPYPLVIMSSDLSWEHQFCLACDRQTDGTTYCSESCRLSDYEKCSTSPYGASSPPRPTSWMAPKPQAKFYLSPAYDFTNAQPYGSAPVPQTPVSQRSDSSSARILTPSSSHSSLCSLQSTSSATSDSNNLSDKARKQLRDYASSFEHARLQRRRSN